MFNTCSFKIKLEAFHEAGHYIKIKFDWISLDNDNKPIFPVHDSGYFKDWTTVQIQGEERVEVQQSIDEIQPVGKKGAPPVKKPAPAKGPQKGNQLEEITDNRPREICFEKDFNVENGEAIEVNDEVATQLSKAFMNVQIIDVNRETTEETLSQTIKLDLSALLFPQDKLSVSVLFCLTFNFSASVYLVVRQAQAVAAPLAEDFGH